MTFLRSTALVLCLSTTAVWATPAPQGSNRLSKPEESEGWELLFDGTRAFGFRGYGREDMPEQGWIAENGNLRHVPGGGGGDLVTREPYRDFEFTFNWKVAPGANSGVIYRVTEDHGATYETGPEYQVLDDSAHPELHFATGAGALYGLYTSERKALRAPGMWNEGRIVVVGNRVQHWLNGERVVDVMMHTPAWDARVAETKFAAMPDFGTRASGLIALQDHGDEVWYRALKVRAFGPSPDRDLSPFNGKNLNGFTETPGEVGAVPKSWVVEEGALYSTTEGSGYLLTSMEYLNFHLSTEWQVPAAGAAAGVLLRGTLLDGGAEKGLYVDLTAEGVGAVQRKGGFLVEEPNGSEGGRMEPRERPELAAGSWHQLEVTCWRGDVVVRIDGRIVNQLRAALEAPGQIGLRTAGGKAAYRGLGVWRLGIDGYKGRATKALRQPR